MKLEAEALDKAKAQELKLVADMKLKLATSRAQSIVRMKRLITTKTMQRSSRSDAWMKDRGTEAQSAGRKGDG